MSELDDLERRASRDPESVDPEAHARLAERYWERTRNTDDFRDYRDAFKRTLFFIENAVDHGFSDPERLREFHEVVERACDEEFFYRENQLVLQARIRANRVPGGVDTAPKVLARDRGGTVIDNRTLLLGDLGWQPDTPRPDPETRLEWMREGHRLVWRTGLPDRYMAMKRHTNLELRYVEGDEPRLAPDDMASISRCTSTIVLRAPTGRLACGRVTAVNPDPSDGDADDSSAEDSRVTVDVPSETHYRACMYYLGGKTRIAVVAETSDTPPNDVDFIAST